MVFNNLRFILPKDGTQLPKHVAGAHLMFALIKTAHSVGIVSGVH
jgi:hypothetical protein